MTKIMKNKLFITLVLISFSPWAHAADMFAWKNYLLAVALISLVGGTLLSLRNKSAETRVSKILLAGLYFWVIFFAQLVVLAGIYHFTS